MVDKWCVEMCDVGIEYSRSPSRRGYILNFATCKWVKDELPVIRLFLARHSWRSLYSNPKHYCFLFKNTVPHWRKKKLCVNLIYVLCIYHCIGGEGCVFGVGVSRPHVTGENDQSWSKLTKLTKVAQSYVKLHKYFTKLPTIAQFFFQKSAKFAQNCQKILQNCPKINPNYIKLQKSAQSWFKIAQNCQNLRTTNKNCTNVDKGACQPCATLRNSVLPILSIFDNFTVGQFCWFLSTLVIFPCDMGPVSGGVWGVVWRVCRRGGCTCVWKGQCWQIRILHKNSTRW